MNVSDDRLQSHPPVLTGPPPDASPETASDGAEPGLDMSAPALATDAELDSALEALLLVVDAPTEDEVLAGALEQPVARVRAALLRLAERYTAERRGIDLRRAGGGWRFYTREAYAPYVERMLLDGQRARLTRAALETLAVVAYRQPVTKAEIEAIRGVQAGPILRTLVDRGLVRVEGRADVPGHPLQYGTTRSFLDRFGLGSLEELPRDSELSRD